MKASVFISRSQQFLLHFDEVVMSVQPLFETLPARTLTAAAACG